jgi:hypothetical protein
MARLTTSLLLSLTFAARAALGAEPAPAARTGELPSALAAPKAANTAPAQPAKAKSVSPAVAAILATQVPKFDPNAPKPKARLDPSEVPESDDPKNKIIRLDPVLVRDIRNPILNPLLVYTKDGLAEYAFRRYITSEVDRALNRFTLPLFGSSMRERAMMMYRDEERLRNMSDVSDMARIVSITDGEAGMYIKKVGDQTFMRKSEFGYQGAKSPTGNR